MDGRHQLHFYLSVDRLVNDKFWYLIAVIDLYSRYIVGWELSSSMRADDVKRVIDFSLLEFGFYESENKPRIHMDNGPHLSAVR